MQTDQGGLDTELARLLHDTKRIDLRLLKSLLQEALASTPQGGLAGLLVARGHLTREEARALLSRVSSASGDGTLYHTLDSNQGGSLPIDAWQPGARVGKYELLRRVGAGAMGMVFLAKHLGTGGRYAVKTVVPDAGEDLLERFRREGEAQAKVDQHPNVVRVHSQGEIHGRPYLVMELATGGDLAGRIRQGALPLPEAVRIARDLAWGLAHMHARGVLHRDLKPANVLFDEADTPKLVDFGLARFDGARSMTHTGEVVGTPVYMPPEQALGRKDLIGPASDVYGLGGILFRMMTGRLPYEGTTAIEIYQKLLNEDPPRPRDLNPEIPPALELVCLKAMARDPADRCSAEDLARELESFLDAEEAEEEEEERSKRPLIIAIVAGLLLIAVITAIGVWATRAPAESAQDAKRAEPETEETSAKTEVPAPLPKPVKETLRWRFQVGDRMRCLLSSDYDVEWTIQKSVIKLANQYLLRCRALAVAPEKVTLEATVERLVVNWTFQGQERGAYNMSFDSRRDPKHPHQKAIGRTFQFDLVPATGRVTEVRGVEEIQKRIWEGMDRWLQMRHRIAAFESAAGMQDLLNAALHLLPKQEDQRNWTHTRGFPDLIGVRNWRRGRGQMTRRRQGGLKRVEPPALLVPFRRVRAPRGIGLRFSNRKRVDEKPYAIPNWTVHQRVERKLSGKAHFQGGRLQSAEIKDSWRGLYELRTEKGQQRTYPPSTGVAKLTFKLVEGE